MDLLCRWNSSLTPEIDDNLWFPIYIDYSLMKEFEADAITKTLKNELSLTEEDMKILQTSKACDTTLPNILIIFDGCDTAVQKLLEEFLMLELDNKNCNVPSIIGAEKYNTVKILITCREESLQGIKRRDFLFAPIQCEELFHRSSNSSDLFLQRRIEPFSDEQITRYLRKCFFYKSLETSNETEIQENKDITHPSELPPNLYPSSSSLWDAVKKFERTMDSHGLREIARIPLMLKMMVEVLPSIAADSISYQDQSQAKTHISYQLIKQFIDGRNKSNSSLRFHDPLILEYLVAEQIKEELIRLSIALFKNEKLVIQEELLLNQHLLNLRAPQNMTIRILCDAVKVGEISNELLFNIVNLSRQEQITADSPIQMRAEDEVLQIEDEEESKQCIMTNAQQQFNQLLIEEKFRDSFKEESHARSHFAVAAANAITILNLTGFDFSNYNLSNICIKDANLSYGIFEKTNFANANLQRVIFTGAWLKDANLQRANLQGVDFGEDSDLKIWDGFIRGISYSRNGKYLAVDTLNQTLVYENFGSRYTSYKKVKKFSGNFSTISTCPFTIDSKQVLTLLENQISIWDIESGELRRNFDIGFRTVLGISPDVKKIIFRRNQSIEIYSIEGDSSIHLLNMSETEKAINCDASLNRYNIFAFGVEFRGFLLYQSTTGERLRNQRQRGIESCKISSNGKQIACKSKGRVEYVYSSKTRKFEMEQEVVIQISDVVRGHSTKVLKYLLPDSNLGSLKFEGDLLSYMRDNCVHILDTTGTKAVSETKCDTKTEETKIEITMFSLLPEGRLAATVKNGNTISFKNLYHSDDDFAIWKENMNLKGLNLQGITATPSVGLSEENIMLFVNKGEYGSFHKQLIKSIFERAKEDKYITF